MVSWWRSIKRFYVVRCIDVICHFLDTQVPKFRKFKFYWIQIQQLITSDYTNCLVMCKSSKIINKAFTIKKICICIIDKSILHIFLMAKYWYLTQYVAGSKIYVKWWGRGFLKNGLFWSKKLCNHPPPYIWGHYRWFGTHETPSAP